MSGNLRDEKYSWRDRENLAELAIFLIATCLMAATSADYSFTLPMYAAFVIILFRNLYLYKKTRDFFFLFKCLFYSIVIPDNYIVSAVLFLCTVLSLAAYGGKKIRSSITKNDVYVFGALIIFFAINVLLSPKLFPNILFAIFYGSAFPLAYILFRLERREIAKRFEDIVSFIKGIVFVEIISTIVYFVFNFSMVISTIDNDWISGTFGVRHGNLLLFFMIFSILLLEKHYKKTKEKTDLAYIAVLVVLSILTNSVALTIMFFIAFVLISIVRAKNVRVAVLSVLITVVAGLFFFFIASPKWIQTYLVRLSNPAYLKEGIPKIITYEDIFIEIPSYDKKFLLIGNGAGQLSSRAALLATGEYIPEIKKIMEPSMSEYTEKYILERYKKYNVDLLHGTMYSPYSSIISIFGEYGLVGLLAFVILIFVMIRKSKKEAAIFIVFFFLSCFVENYVEFAKVVVPLFFLYFVDRKEKNEK